MNNCPTNTCISEYNAECVIYHIDNTIPSKLSNLGLPNRSNISDVLEHIDSLLGNNFSLVLQKEDTPSINLTLTGITLKGDVNISEQSNNILEIKEDGLFVKGLDGKIKVSSTDINPDYAKNKLVGDTDSIVSISITEVTGGVLKIKPTINIQALLTAISNSPALLAYFKNM